MNSTEFGYENLEQYDYVTDEYIFKVANKYSTLIGQFMINFSILEHELNVVISEFISHRAHETGYIIIEKLTMSSKIDLFYKLYHSLESNKNLSEKSTRVNKLKNLKDGLSKMNTFRNIIVHANWQTLLKDGSVRTKIIFDNEEGSVKLRKVTITPKNIRDNIKKILRITNSIYKYGETAFNF